MKANKNFRMEDEAVSPVIGVILMVAITVVLAAVVFVLVSDLGDTKDSAPVISFQKDGDRLKAISADDEAHWDDIKVTFNAACGTVTIVIDGATAAEIAQSGNDATATPDTPVGAGDYIDVTPSGQCELTLTHTPTNQLYDTWNFS